ncbi:MAG: tRNA dihydrouridine(20/20a) synthase DusA [Alcaligenaceae bacterium]|nr:tRNA dihydrouridine(20/20a) synthase DusA [Alcaligenaceae bacterium]
MNIYQSDDKPYRLSVAPMLDVTDRHCRYFHRLLSPHALLYTEMVTTGALIYGDVPRHLTFNDEEHPVALQLGGSDTDELVQCARLAQLWGYDEVNLNCGCPSDRVQKGAFGAVLMKDAHHVAHLWKSMQSVVDIPVTIKHRIGIGYDISFEFLVDFVSILYEAGCRVFIVHARNAVLEGLSPKANREVPPLRYDFVYRLKATFPEAIFVINGGIHHQEEAEKILSEPAEESLDEAHYLDGVMMGRAAWHEPYVLRQMSQSIWYDTPHLPIEHILETMRRYAERMITQGVPLRAVVKPMLGLFNGIAGSRAFRRVLSDPALLKVNDLSIFDQAYAHLNIDQVKARFET